MTRHETIASALVTELDAGDLPPLQRDVDLPADCPAEGLARIEFDDPAEVDRRLDGTREWQRDANITLIVAGAEASTRRTSLDALLVRLGALLEAAADASFDYLDIGEPEYDEDVDIVASAAASGVTVPVTLFYETGTNPLEE